jgi:hypothetical protein
MSEAKQPRELVRPYFDRHSIRLDTALRAALAKPIKVEPGRRLLFEVCPYFYGVVLTDTEEVILPDGWLDELPSEVLELVERAGSDSLEVVSQMVVDWLADGWQRVGGPQQYQPAFVFFHGYHDKQFDLERRCWVSAEEAFEV